MGIIMVLIMQNSNLTISSSSCERKWLNMAQKDRSFFRKFWKYRSKSYFKSCHRSKIVKNEFLIMEIPIFFGLIALEMIFSKFVKKIALVNRVSHHCPLGMSLPFCESWEVRSDQSATTSNPDSFTRDKKENRQEINLT